MAEAIARYRTLKATKAAQYDFSSARELNRTGYRLLGAGRTADIIELDAA